MNERIKELAEQSYKEVIETNDYNGSAYTVREFDKDKFAELIVRECVGIVEDAVNHREPASTYVDKIKEHFGVEE